MRCIIPCAGKGSRMGSITPKALLKINGQTVLWQIMQTWKDVVDEFVIVASPSNASLLSPYAPTVTQKEPLGLAHAILQAKPLVKDRFVVALGDCLMKGSFFNPEPLGSDNGYGVWQTQDERLTKLGCAVEVENGRISKLVEKPKIVEPNWYCGLGTYFFTRDVFEYIERTPLSTRGEYDITDTMQLMIEDGLCLRPSWFSGEFVNLTRPEDVKRAEELFID